MDAALQEKSISQVLLKHFPQGQEVAIRKQPPEVFYKKRCSEKFRKIYRKTLVPECLFNKVVGLRPATLLRKSLRHRCFPVNFTKFLRTTFSEHLWATASGRRSFT